MTRKEKEQQYEKYKKLIAAANEAAKAASQSDDDGGTCNMDTVMVNFKGWGDDFVQQLAEETGVSIGDAEKGSYRFIWFYYIGQANNRTRCMEAAYKYLKENGIDATMWYHMD